MSDLTARLAAFIANATVPATVRAAAKPPLVDTVGVVVAGLGSMSADARPGLDDALALGNEPRPATTEDAA